MASIQIFYSLYYNPLLIGKDRLTSRAFIKGSNTLIFTSIPAIFYAPTPAFALTLVVFGSIYTNIDLYKTIKLNLKLLV